MQGVIFRKYIRENYFDLELLALDLAFSLREDGVIHATGREVIECFGAAQQICRAEDAEEHPLDTAQGCFGLYSHAIGLIGTHVAFKDSSSHAIPYRDDSWIDESWATTYPVLNHMNVQMMETLLNDTEAVIKDSDPERKRVNDYIDAALGDTSNAPDPGATVYKMF